MAARLTWSQREQRRDARLYGDWARGALAAAHVAGVEARAWKAIPDCQDRVSYWDDRAAAHIALAARYATKAAHAAHEAEHP